MEIVDPIDRYLKMMTLAIELRKMVGCDVLMGANFDDLTRPKFLDDFAGHQNVCKEFDAEVERRKAAKDAYGILLGGE